MSLASLHSPADATAAPDFVKLWTRAAEAIVGDRAAARPQPRQSVSRYRHLLILRFVLTNMSALALLAVGAVQGWVGTVLLGDETGLTVAILGVFVIGLVTAGWKVWQLSQALNAAENPSRAPIRWISAYVAEAAAKDAGARAIAGSALRMQLANRIGFVKHVANTLVLLGLIGTVIGFIIALGGISADTAADPSAIAPMVGGLLRGMSVALYTTLAGAVLNMWLMINFHMLVGAATRLAGRLVEAGEHAALEAGHERA
ncbi:MAG: MotA/TolQ/ExbB proton channel family protein [Alphaproteobacteria bacterium]